MGRHARRSKEGKRMENKKDLACLINGHIPAPGADASAINTTQCKACGHPLHRSKLWMGMKWKIWYTPISVPKPI